MCEDKLLTTVFRPCGHTSNYADFRKKNPKNAKDFIVNIVGAKYPSLKKRMKDMEERIVWLRNSKLPKKIRPQRAYLVDNKFIIKPSINYAK